MTTSQKGIEFIKEKEGYRSVAYLCSAGVWTIGWGHTKRVGKGDTCTPDQAHAWLLEDLRPVERTVTNLSTVWMQNEFDALVSFGFNLGTGNLVKLVQKRLGPNYRMSIANAMLLYVRANGKPLAGLVKRRAQERKMFLG